MIVPTARQTYLPPQLKPCPFCGVTPERILHTNQSGCEYYYAVTCDSCNAYGPEASHLDSQMDDNTMFATMDQAAARWNKRIS